MLLVRSEVLVIGHAGVTVGRAAHLRAAGHSAWTAFDLEEARRLLERSWIHPSLLIIDLTGDERDRDALVRELAALAAQFSLPVVLVGAVDGEPAAFADVRATLPADASFRLIMESVG